MIFFIELQYKRVIMSQFTLCPIENNQFVIGKTYIKIFYFLKSESFYSIFFKAV